MYRKPRLTSEVLPLYVVGQQAKGKFNGPVLIYFDASSPAEHIVKAVD